jgi:hypothetical protein
VETGGLRRFPKRIFFETFTHAWKLLLTMCFVKFKTFVFSCQHYPFACQHVFLRSSHVFLITALPKTFGAMKMTWIHVFFLVVDMSYLFEEDEIWHFLMRWIFKRVEITMETGFCFVDNVFIWCLCRLFCDRRSFLFACHLSNSKWWSKNMSSGHSELFTIYFAHLEQFFLIC